MSALGDDMPGKYYTRVLKSIQTRIELCQERPESPNFECMPKRFSFKDLLEEAAKSHASFWNDDGRLNLAAVSRYYAAKGHPISQPTLYRNCEGKTEPSEDTIEATHQVFGIPKSWLRGEAVGGEMEELLSQGYRVSTLLLAKRIESLSKESYHAIVEQIEVMLSKEQQIRAAIESAGNVTSIDRRRKT